MRLSLSPHPQNSAIPQMKNNESGESAFGSTNSNPRIIPAGYLSIVLVSLFLTICGAGIWHRAQMAVAPPLNDSLQYYTKASLVWEAISRGKILEILNVAPTIRPPGIAFLLYR
jgi:hypothetical protein